MDLLCYFCLVLSCFCARLFINALWSPAGTGLTYRISFVMSYCEVGILGQVWCLIVSIPDLCTFFYFYTRIYIEGINHSLTYSY